MKRILKIFPLFLVLLMLVPQVSFGASITYQSHLWLGDQDTNFNDYENSPGYVGANADAWLNESIVDSNPFELYIYNASNQIYADNVHIIATIHGGETGTLTVGGVDYFQSDFGNTTLPPGHNSPHGVWHPAGDGLWLDIGTSTDIDMLDKKSFGQISFSGFSMVHFDAYSEPQLVINGFSTSASTGRLVGLRNPYSHDKTSVPEPSTLVLLGSGLIGLALVGRKRIKK